MSKFYFEGQFFEQSIPLSLGENSAFLLGESIFTSTQVISGKPLFLDDHIERTLAAVQELYRISDGVTDNLRKSLVKGITLILQRIQNENYFRMSFFEERGDIKFLIELRDKIIMGKTLTIKTHEKTPRGEIIPAWIKLGSYCEERYVNRLAQQAGFQDTLFVHEKKIYELTTGNIFFVKNKEIFTPFNKGIFAGILREKILNHGKSFGYEVSEKDIFIQDIKNYDFAFLTNSVRLAVGIEKIDDIQFSLDMDFLKELNNSLKELNR